MESYLSMEQNSLEFLVRIEKGAIFVIDQTSLAGLLHTDLKKFLRSKKQFETCVTMLDFIRWYNLLDCDLLCRAIKNFAAGFLQDWNTNIHQFKSVSLLFFDLTNN